MGKKMQIQYKTDPISTSELRLIAKKVRQKFNLDKSLYFPILTIVDDFCIDGLLDYQVLSEDDERLPKDVLSSYSIQDNLILIKESVYREVCNNVGRSRFTLAHEFAHYLLFYIKKFHYSETLEKPKAYEDPEWQANMLASELLVPFDETKEMNIKDIEDTCGVSEECAIVVTQKRKKKNIVKA